MIRCLACESLMELPDMQAAVHHFQRMHWDLLAGLSEYEQADAIAKGLRRVER